MTSLIARIVPPSELRSSPSTRIVGFILLGLACLACLMGLAAFGSDQTAPNGWLPYLSSTVLVMGAIYTLIPYKKSANIAPPITLSTAALALLILVLAIALRFYRIDSLPAGTWNDEAYIGTTAEAILTEPDYAPIYVVPYSHPLHFYGLVALAFKLIGYGMPAIRMVSAVFGVGAVIAAFFAGREAFGNRFGLCLAFLFAISRWHITFSRFGLFTITVPFFEMLTIWLLLRARRTGQIHDFAWAGLAFGYGLNFYIGIRLFIPVVVIFIILWVVSTLWRKARNESTQSQPLRPLISGLIVFSITALFAVAPLAQYALTHPEEYWSREGTVSIFTTHDNPSLAGAVYNNTLKHLLMFNYIGDANGRHNLSGEPMLDPLTGVLFVLGLALALSRPRHPIHSLFLLLFVFSLVGGIFSLDFEAPQANRSLGVICAVLYFAALTLETIWRAVEHSQLFSGARRGLTSLLAVGMSVYLIFFNTYTYFGRQVNDQRTWLEFNGTESLTARRMLELDLENTNIYASVFLNNHEVIRFLAPQITNSTAIIPPVGLPVHEAGDKQVAIFVDPQNTWVIDEVHQFYPDATYQTDTSPDGNPVLYSAIISPEQVQSIQGATVKYWAGTTVQGEPVINDSTKTIAVRWPEQAPLAEPFVSVWETTLYTSQAGDYQFNLESPGLAKLSIDGQVLLEGSGNQEVFVTLAQGDHALQLEAQSGNGAMALRWRLPGGTEVADIPPASLYLPNRVPVQGLRGQYFSNETWSSPPQIDRVDAFIDTYFHIIPLPRPFSVDWSGRINLTSSGNWVFGLRITGKAEVFIDDQLIINATEPTELVEGTVNLEAGWHQIRIRYLDYLGASRIHLYWTTPDGVHEIVPRWALLPY